MIVNHRMFPVVKLASRNVVKNWRHSLAAILSIAAGFVAFALFEGYIDNLRSFFAQVFSQRQMLGDLVIEKTGAQQAGLDDPWSFQLTESDQSFLNEFLTSAGPAVSARVRFLNTTGMASNGRTSIVFVGMGYDVAEGARMRGPEWLEDAAAGIPLHRAGDEDIVLGKVLGKALGCEKNGSQFVCERSRVQVSAMTADGQLNAVQPEVVGLVDATFKELDARHVRMPLGLAQQLLDTPFVSLYSVKLSDPSQATAFVDKLRAAAAAHNLQLDIMRWQDHPKLGDVYRRTMSLMEMFEVFITTVVVAVAGMSLLNAMVKSVSERTREIGLLRSLGFKRKQIVVLFVIEGMLLSLLGSAIGLLASVALSFIVNSLGVEYRGGLLSEPIKLAVTLGANACTVAAVMLVVVASAVAWIPARRAAAQSISTSLGHV